MAEDPGPSEEVGPRRYAPAHVLTLMFYAGAAVWWTLTKALPWLGVPPLCITVLWIMAYLVPAWLAEKIAKRLHH